MATTKAPHGFHLDGTEVFAGDIQNGRAGQQEKQNPGKNDEHAGTHDGSAFQFIRNVEDGVHVVLAVVVMVDHLEGLFPGDPRLPAIVFQVAGDTGDGVGMDKQVDRPSALPSLP
jgi:hypothetical protein